MEMDVKDRLTRAGIVIRDDAEAFFSNSFLTGYPGGNTVDVADQLIISRVEIKSVHKMLPGYDQDV